ncbi:Om45p [Saccharomyces cerevisiae x Saccharomyces kudriavzevii VIN7]|uniref:Om45p n=1 Tax=Saccharomyces cerevisiae x Saccharomyces kudriavzevii (strain VIN7) TaxID=1095631 RepID=H0GW56_SACCK|nr:Om45p [Saccharomyces cerevisiae x Saccharomyces kudriavzevii VIN7]
MSSRIIVGSAALAAAITASIMVREQKAKGKGRDSKVSVCYNSQEYGGSAPPQWGKLHNITQGIKEDALTLKDALLGVSQKAREEAPEAARRVISPEEDSETRRQLSQKAKDNSSQSIFNWGFSEAERRKAIAIGEFDTAKKRFEEAVNRNERELLSAVMREKKAALDRASIEYERYGKARDFNELSDKLDQQERESNPLKRLLKKNVSDGSTEEAAARSVQGWGETAQEFGREELEEAKRNASSEPSDAQKRLDELKKIKEKGWFRYNKGEQSEEQIAERVARGLEGWGETAAQLSRDEMDDLRWNYENSKKQLDKNMSDAMDSLSKAKEDLKQYGSHWWAGWTSKVDSDKQALKDEAQKKYDDALKKYDDAKNKFKEWSDNDDGKFWSSKKD